MMGNALVWKETVLDLGWGGSSQAFGWEENRS
jgi:hypothetical protein